MRRILIACVLLVAPVRLASAQTPILFDHVEIATSDFDVGRAWYAKHFGGKADARPDHVWFATTWMGVLMKTATAKPSSQGTIDHIAFSVPNLEARVKEIEAAGAKVVAPIRNVAGWFKSAIVDDPNGVRIELVDDAELRGFHHVHMRLADPDAGRAWFLRMLGGDAMELKNASGIRYGDMRVLFDKGDRIGSAGFGLDHLAFRMQKPRLDALVDALKAENTVFLRAPFSYANGPISGTTTFVEGPGRTRLELLARNPDYKAPE
jgi:predicted enzyme related to lactoylglutathione lyase